MSLGKIYLIFFMTPRMRFAVFSLVFRKFFETVGSYIGVELSFSQYFLISRLSNMVLKPHPISIGHL